MTGKSTLLFVAALATPGAGMAQDDRTLVKLPETMRNHMLANMRDHLASSSPIQAAYRIH